MEMYERISIERGDEFDFSKTRRQFVREILNIDGEEGEDGEFEEEFRTLERTRLIESELRTVVRTRKIKEELLKRTWTRM